MEMPSNPKSAFAPAAATGGFDASVVLVTCKARFCRRRVKQQVISSEADVGVVSWGGLAGR